MLARIADCGLSGGSQAEFEPETEAERAARESKLMANMSIHFLNYQCDNRTRFLFEFLACYACSVFCFALLFWPRGRTDTRLDVANMNPSEAEFCDAEMASCAYCNVMTREA
jgi:hypothetical protein